ncbi:MAG: GNAT family N-acetyltransferase [Pyrinomonadaceae bacterium]|nr:GNAT family N-acetyltransferase [Sphingobacteriaceae bacterium]
MKYMLEMMYSLTSLSHQMQQEHQFILAQYHHVYVGYASYQIHYNGLAATKIHKLYVLPSQHRKGIGKHLLNSISQVALRHENPTLLLNVNKKNPAINFYQKNGFVQIREERILIGNGFIMDDYVMEKKLPDTFSSGSTA